MGAGSVAVVAAHTWAFFDSALTLVALRKVTIEIGASCLARSKRWVGRVAPCQDVYGVPKELSRHPTKRVADRDVALRGYPAAVGAMGTRLAGLRGHIVLTAGIPGQLVDPELYRCVVDTFSYLLRAQYLSGNSPRFPWLLRIEGEAGG